MDDNANLTFSELKYLKVEDILMCVTKEAALQITKHAQQDETIGAEILSVWVNKLLQTYSLTAAEWKRLSQYLKDSLQQKILVTNPAEKHILDLKSWLGDCMKLMEWLQPSMVRLDLECTCIALIFVLQTELAFLNFHRVWHMQNNLGEALQSALLLQNSVVKALSQNIANLELASESQFSTFTEVIVTLSGVGEQTQLIDIKTIVETWKCVAKLVNYLAKYLHLEQKPPTTERSWVKRPLLFLLQEIARNLSTIYNEKTLQQPVEQVEKYLRVTNFYLKLLLGLTSDFKHNQFPAVDELVNILGLSKRVPTYFRDTEITKLLEKYVQNSLKDLVRMVYKHADLKATILRQEDSAIVLHYLDGIVDEQDIGFFCNNGAGFVELFEFFFNDINNVTNAAVFLRVLQASAALAVLDVSAKFKAYLRENVLKGDMQAAFASTLLLLIVPYPASAELLNEFQFWRQCNDFFALSSTHGKQFLIQQLLRHFFRMCKSSKELTMEQIWDGCSATELMPKDYRFLLAVGLDAAASDTKQHSIANTLLEIIDEGFQDGSKDKYYKMVAHINLLATAKTKPTEQLLVALFQLVERICSFEDEIIKEFHQFLKASYALAMTFIKTISPTSLLILLKSVPRAKAAVIRVPCTRWLKACCQHTNLEIRTIAAGLLKDYTAEQTNKPALAVLNVKSIEGKLDADLFPRLSIKPAKRHICCATTNSSPASKRLRLEALESTDTTELRSILHDMLSKSQTLLELDLRGNLEQKDLRTLHGVLNTLCQALAPK